MNAVSAFMSGKIRIKGDMSQRVGGCSAADRRIRTLPAWKILSGV
jgi:putative sterol carrier protein